MYDVIVVGLGPGGSMAAYELSKGGLRVLALDQAVFPRYKPCGGCLSLKVTKIFKEDLTSVIVDTIYGGTLTFHGEVCRVRSRRPVAFMVMRDTFDAFLAEKAKRAGAEIHDGERVTNVEEGDHSVRVTTEKGVYEARAVIGADGVRSKVARAVGLHPQEMIAVAAEAEVTTNRPIFEATHGEVLIDFGAIPYGYGWIFPKGDHLSLGVAGIQEKVGSPKPYYQEFLEDQRLLEKIESEQRHGYILPGSSGRKMKISRGHVVLVGDAAGLVDPFIGEGIYYAMQSGQLAAKTILEAFRQGSDDFSEYEQMIDQGISSEFRYASKLASFVYRFPRIGFLALKNGEIAEQYFDVLRGERSYRELWPEVKRQVGINLLRFIGLLKQKDGRARKTYDRIAPFYDTYLTLWKDLVGAAPWSYLESAIREIVKDGALVLDAGTGTGEATRMILEQAHPAKVMGIDLSEEMLNIAQSKIRDPRATFALQDMTELPYPDNTFDVVISTWAIETLTSPKKAVAEFLRVIKDDGYVVYAFSSFPAKGIGKLYASILERALGHAFDWRFLSREERPYHDCERSRLVTFLKGLGTVVILRKCCMISDEVAPCVLPEDWEKEEK